MLVIILPIPLDAQSTEEAEIPAPESKKTSLNVRVVALGHRRMAKFERSDKVRIVKIRTPDGKTIEEKIPAGVPTEVKGKPFEYLPALVYLRERGLKDGKRHVIAPLVLNSASPSKKLSHRAKLNLLILQPAEDKNSKPAFRTYASADVGQEQSHLIVALINRHDQQEGWRNPIVRSFDVSPGKLPGGSILFFNSTPFPMEVDVMLQGKYQTVTVEPMASRQYMPARDSDGRSLLRAKIVARNGAKKQIYYNTVKVDDNGRTYLFAYYDPRKKTSNPAGLVHFTDEIPQSKLE